MSDADSNDSDTTVIIKYNVEHIKNKYKNIQFELGSSSSNENDRASESKRSRNFECDDEELDKVQKDAKDMLTELLKKYNVSNEPEKQNLTVAEYSPPILLSDDDDYENLGEVPKIDSGKYDTLFNKNYKISRSNDSQETLSSSTFPSPPTSIHSNESDELPKLKNIKKIEYNENDLFKLSLPSTSSLSSTQKDFSNESQDYYDELSELPKIKSNLRLKRRSKEDLVEKAQKLLEKQKERQKKKEETERSKEIKMAMRTVSKNMKPDECVKFITAVIDQDIISSPYGKEVINKINELGSQYKCTSQYIPNTITWVRKVQSHLLDENGKLTLSSNDEDEEHVLFMLTGKELAKLIAEKNFVARIKSVKSLFSNKRVSLVICGIDSYYRLCKDGKDKKSKGEQIPFVSRKKLEFALTEIQILCSCSYRFVEKPDEFAAMVAQFTKAVAQIPFKMQKQEKHEQAEWYMSGDNKDCVRVDSNGNGLQRLWQQHLTSFPLARIETAEAVISNYPTLKNLFEAYDNCDTENAKEKMIQDIPIRRAAGPLTNVRKIGPELSKKMFTFYNTMDGETIL